MRVVLLSLAATFLLGVAILGIYDITTPTVIVRVVNKSPEEVLGPRGVLKEAEFSKRKFHFQLIVIDLPSKEMWREYKESHGQEEYVHGYTLGGATIFTDNPRNLFHFLKEKGCRWRVYPPPSD
jgi:hypothetical protein